MDDGSFVSLAPHPEALADDCERAALVVTTRQAPHACASAVIDRGRLQRQGTMALRRTRHEFTVDAAKPRGLDRPWAPAIAGDTDAEAILLTPRRTVPRDATPAEADLQAED
jgi:competence protein ComEC